MYIYIYTCIFKKVNELFLKQNVLNCCLLAKTKKSLLLLAAVRHVGLIKDTQLKTKLYCVCA